MSEVLWTLTKPEAEAYARARTTAYGTELRIMVNGELEWSRTFRGDTATAVTNAAEDKRREFVEQGWGAARFDTRLREYHRVEFASDATMLLTERALVDFVKLQPARLIGPDRVVVWGADADPQTRTLYLSAGAVAVAAGLLETITPAQVIPAVDLPPHFVLRAGHSGLDDGARAAKSHDRSGGEQ